MPHRGVDRLMPHPVCYRLVMHGNSNIKKNEHTFLIISRSILLRMRNVSEKVVEKNKNTHFVFNNILPKIVPFVR